MAGPDDAGRSRLKTRAKSKGGVSGEERAVSYGIGGFLLLLGIGLMVGYTYMDRGPGKLFHLMAAGGVASALSGVGLFLSPLDDERMHAFQKEPNPISVFRIMPGFWKAWMLLILAAMVGAFVFVSQTTVRVGR